MDRRYRPCGCCTPSSPGSSWLVGRLVWRASRHTRLLQKGVATYPTTKAATRYVVYLDGIGQSTFEYLPDIQEFLGS